MRVFVLVCVLLGGMGQGVVSPRMPELLSGSSRLALDSGLSAALMYLGIFVSTLFYGRVADRGRVHWLLTGGLACYAVMLLLLGLSRTPAEIFTLRFFEGLSLAAIYVAADFVLGRLSPENERGKWLSFYGVALSIGLVLGPLASLGAPRVATALGANTELASAPLLPLAAVAAIVLVFSAFSFNWRISAAPTATERVSLDPRPLIAGSAYGFMEAALVAIFPVLAVRELHVVPETCLLVAIGAAAVFSIGWGVLSDRVGARPVTLMLIGLLAVAPAGLAMLHGSASPANLAYSSCCLFGLIAGGLYPVGFSWLLEGANQAHYGYASGAFARAYGIGALAGPLVAGVWCERAGFSGLLLALSAIGILAAVTISWVGLNKRKRVAITPRFP